MSDLTYLRRYKAGKVQLMITGRVLEDSGFGYFNKSSDEPGLPGATVTLTGNGLDRSTVTDNRRQFVFTPVPGGIYNIRAAIYPYTTPQPERSVWVLLDRGCGYQEFDMYASGEIEGRLHDHWTGHCPM